MGPDEIQRLEYRNGVRCTFDRRFGLPAGLSGRLESRALVGDPVRGGEIVLDRTLDADPQGLVARGEGSLGMIEVRIPLLDGPQKLHRHGLEVPTDVRVVDPDLPFDLVHADRGGDGAIKGFPSDASVGNGVLKKRTPLTTDMSEDPAETDEASVEESEESPAGEDEQPAEDEDTIDEDDFVTLAVTAYSTESDQLVDTTDEELAEEEGVDTDEQTFEPRTIPLGEGHLFPSVEDDIAGRKVGESATVEVPADEAFGEYDPDNVRTVSADTIPEDDRYPGAHVDIDGEHGHVETIIGGRARVDFNHPLAGESIEYEYEILDRTEDRLEQAQALLGSVIDADLEMWIETEEEEQEVPVEDADEDEEEPETTTETVEVEVLYVESVPQLALNQQWMFRKQQIAQSIIDRLGVERVVIQETIEGMGGGLGGLGGMGEALEDVDVDPEEIAEEVDEAAEVEPVE